MDEFDIVLVSSPKFNLSAPPPTFSSSLHDCDLMHEPMFLEVGACSDTVDDSEKPRLMQRRKHPVPDIPVIYQWPN